MQEGAGQTERTMTTRPRLLRGALLLTLLACAGVVPAASPLPSVTLIFDPAGQWDNSTNQAAHSGLERAIREHGLPFGTASTATPQDALREARAAARSGTALVIGVGTASAPALSTAAREYPRVRFIGVDALPTGPNTAGLRFREQEGAFLAGVLAANTTSTRRLGVITRAGDRASGRYRAGFTAGVAFACPGCQVFHDALPGTGDGNLVAATTLARRQYARGADIILAAVGGANRGVVTAATGVQCLRASALPAGVRFLSDVHRQVPRGDPYRAECRGQTRPVFAIATESAMLDRSGDSDVDAATLNHTLTSVVKRADQAVFAVVDEVARGRPWRGGDRSFGLANGGIELSLNEYNAALVSRDLKVKLDKVRRLIVDGLIQVPAQ